MKWEKTFLTIILKTQKKIAAMVKVAGAFMGGYDYYKKSQKYENEETDFGMAG